jgi:hypothetical protein
MTTNAMTAEDRLAKLVALIDYVPLESGRICARTSLGLSVMAFLRKTISRRVICVEKAKRSILPFSGVVDADPFRGNHAPPATARGVGG